MPFAIRPVEDCDVPRTTELIADGLVEDGIQEYVAATWPGFDTAEGRAEACSRFRTMKTSLPDPRQFLKVVDETTGSIVACSICLHSPTPPKTLSGLPEGAWKTEGERGYAQHLRKERNELLLRIFARLQCPVTEILAFFVDASLQRQGIGRMLMRHLVDRHAQRGASVVLIANPTARGFYEKQGFRVEDDALLPVPERWQDRPRAHLVSMIYTG